MSNLGDLEKRGLIKLPEKTYCRFDEQCDKCLLNDVCGLDDPVETFNVVIKQVRSTKINVEGVREQLEDFLRNYKEISCIDDCYLKRLAQAITEELFGLGGKE